jgi:hypothetical protein
MPFVITPSAFKQDDRRRDQILIGGPVHNRYTSQLICGSLDHAHEGNRVVFDADRRYICPGEMEWGPNLDPLFHDNVPTVEYAVVLLTPVSRYGGRQRVIATGGLTTYGTHAGGHFISHHLVDFAQQHRLGTSPNICILVRAALVGGQPYDLQPVHWIPVNELGVSPQGNITGETRPSEPPLEAWQKRSGDDLIVTSRPATAGAGSELSSGGGGALMVSVAALGADVNTCGASTVGGHSAPSSSGCRRLKFCRGHAGQATVRAGRRHRQLHARAPTTACSRHPSTTAPDFARRRSPTAVRACAGDWAGI